MIGKLEFVGRKEAPHESNFQAAMPQPPLPLKIDACDLHNRKV